METYQKQNNRYYANIKPKLSRDIANKRIAGVCAGIGKYFNIKVSWVRTVWFLRNRTLEGGRPEKEELKIC